MEDEAILLKIKREFTTNEAVQVLLKMISELEVEKGMLKSELSEALDMAKKIRQEKTLTKKQWMQEEIFKHMNEEAEVLKIKVKEYKKSKEEWQYKYFNLLAKTGVS